MKNALLVSGVGVNLGLAALEGGDLEATDEGVQALQTTMQKSRKT